MPYKIQKNGSSKKPYCVYNSETGDKKGCSVDRKSAIGHMRALYAAENKEFSDKQIDDLLIKSVAEYQEEYEEFVPPEEIFDEKHYPDSPAEVAPMYTGMSTSYDEYDAMKDAWEKTREVEELLNLFPSLARNAMDFGDAGEDKASKIESLSQELAERIRTITAESDTEESDVEDKAISKREDVSPSDKKRATSEYGNVKYADAKNKKYPIDTPAHIRAAWNYINMPRNASKYSSAEVSSIKSKIVSAWKSKISKDGPPSAKEMKSNISLMAEHTAYYLKSILGLDNEQAEDDLMFWKDADSGRMMWLARYSNNFIDDDSPPDIISESSHRQFVENVDKGVYPYPELWLWHQKEWSLGKAVWCAYDDSGFAVAAGYIYPGREPVAEQLSQLKNIGLSHGMPVTSIVRDENDERVIVQHQTKEISVLPLWAAANMLTSFELLKGDGNMLPKDKRKQAIEQWGIDEALLDKLEKLNLDTAKEADEVGLERKEKGDEQTSVETPPETNTAAPVSEKEGEAKTEEVSTEKPGESAEPVVETPTTDFDRSPSIKEVAEAINNVFAPQIEALVAMQAKVDELTKQVAEMSGKIVEVEKETKEGNDMTSYLRKTSPVASMLAMFEGNRAVGSNEAVVKEGELESRPKQNNTAVNPITGVPFIDQMITQSQS